MTAEEIILRRARAGWLGAMSGEPLMTKQAIADAAAAAYEAGHILPSPRTGGVVITVSGARRLQAIIDASWLAAEITLSPTVSV